jgi:hypothetical protein
LAPEAVVPSPKFQVMVFALALVLLNVQVVDVEIPDVGDIVNEAVGFTDVVVVPTTTDLLAVEFPAVFFTVNVTLYVFAAEYLCVTFLAELVSPSPKFQLQLVGELVLVSLNVYVVAVVPPDAGDTVNEDVGFASTTGFTDILPVLLLVPLVFVAVKVTVKIFALLPVLLNVCETCVPFITAVPSPKFQDRLVAFVDVLVNSTVSGEFPELTLLVKFATGSIVVTFPGITSGR